MTRDSGTSESWDEKDFRQARELTDQRRIYKRKPKTALNLVNDVIALRGVAAQKSNSKLQGIWDSVVGMDVANRTRVGPIRRGILIVEVANSNLLQELEFEKQNYKELINQQITTTQIKDLRFRIGRIN